MVVDTIPCEFAGTQDLNVVDNNLPGLEFTRTQTQLKHNIKNFKLKKKKKQGDTYTYSFVLPYQITLQLSSAVTHFCCTRLVHTVLISTNRITFVFTELPDSLEIQTPNVFDYLPYCTLFICSTNTWAQCAIKTIYM